MLRSVTLGKAEIIQILIAMTGVAICLLGFLRYPHEKFELIAPRFVIPGLFCVGIYGDFFYWALHDDPYQYEEFLYLSGTTSLIFTTLCLIGFWLGFILPIGRKAAQKIDVLHTEILVPDRLLYKFSGIVAATITLIALAVTGGAYIDVRLFSGASLFTKQASILSVMVQMLMVIGALAVGMAWPERSNWGRRLALFLFLLLIAAPNFAKFSRGAGLTFLICAFAFSIRYRRFNWIGLSLAAIACVVGANAGLTGRLVYGHYAGVIPFLEHVILTLDDHFAHSLDMVFSAVGKWSVTSVVVTASEGHIYQSPWWKWIWFQTPLPRPFTAPFGLTPTGVGLSVKHYIGGVESRGYTPSLFGDAYGHMHYWGFVMFIPIGIIGRFVESLSIRPKIAHNVDSLNLSAMLLPVLYMALLLGFHNTYRSFVVAFSYPFYMLIFAVFVLRSFSGSVWLVKSSPHLIR